MGWQYNAVKFAPYTHIYYQKLGRFLYTAPFSKEHLLGRKPHFVVVTIIISNISLLKDEQAAVVVVCYVFSNDGKKDAKSEGKLPRKWWNPEPSL